jgi:hypothetical protein
MNGKYNTKNLGPVRRRAWSRVLLCVWWVILASIAGAATYQPTDAWVTSPIVGCVGAVQVGGVLCGIVFALDSLHVNHWTRLAEKMARGEATAAERRELREMGKSWGQDG